MNETSINDEPQPKTEAYGADAEPQFGLLNVVEAFTAMRHEWRTQAKQNRELAQSMQASMDLLARIESTLDQKLSAATSDGDLRKFISLVIDLDLSLTRAVEATSESVIETEKAERVLNVRRLYEQSGFFSRMFSRKIYQQIVDAIQNESRGEPNSTIEGVRLVHNRLRRMMSEQNLIRVETIGSAFDGETMKAISAIESDNAESGVVVQEIAPAYLYNGQIVRVAEVRVAK